MRSPEAPYTCGLGRLSLLALASWPALLVLAACGVVVALLAGSSSSTGGTVMALRPLSSARNRGRCPVVFTSKVRLAPPLMRVTTA